MRSITLRLQLAAVLLGVVAAGRAVSLKDKRQISTEADTNPAASDPHVSETGFVGAVQAGSKYFQYAHQPAKDHYEHGHKRGNDHHFIERHEKVHPHAGEFKTKVRWGDKHGGYGEHYWDYNHAGHGSDGEEGETIQNEQYAVPPQSEELDVAGHLIHRKKREPIRVNDDVEFIDDRYRHLVLSGASGKHGGNYKRDPRSGKNKKGQKKAYGYQ